jgi:hypothetical protein
MAYGHQSHASGQIEPIFIYAEACEREAGIKTIRGTKIKPLGPRRHKEMQILKQPNGDIACRLYQTDVVIYKPNGDIVVQVGGWASPTTTAFMGNILRGRFYQFDNQVWVSARTEEQDEDKPFPLLTHGDNVFRRSRSGGLFLTNPQSCKTHKINREGANNVRKRYKSFRNYIDRMFRLRAVNGLMEVGLEEIRAMFSNGEVLVMPPLLRVDSGRVTPKERLAEFQQLIEDHGVADKTQDFYRAFLWLVHSIDLNRRWRGSDLALIIKQLDEVTFYMHRGEAFVETEHFGEQKKDSYAKFFSN